MFAEWDGRRVALISPSVSIPLASFTFGTKAETLSRIGPLLTKSQIPDFDYFTLDEWRQDWAGIIGRVFQRFFERRLIVRSSAIDEDGDFTSGAGRYLSMANVFAGDPEYLADAIDKVFASYETGAAAGALRNQVLVQEMIGPVSLSGVLFTQELNSGAPYYVINYDDETGRTDTVSAGNTAYSNRTLLVHRADVNLLSSPRFEEVLAAIQELERITGSNCLDVELALDNDLNVYIFQVRPITTQGNWNSPVATSVSEAVECVRRRVRARMRPLAGVRGSRSILGKMPDWNPVEMIGTAPRPLALSLYRHLITDRTWRRARRRMGYAEPPGAPLLLCLEGQPFIDVRLSFHSFLPGDLSAEVGNKLVDGWLDYLGENSHLHDKVEFEVAVTALTFDFEQRMGEQYAGLLSATELEEFRDRLGSLTGNLLSGAVTPISGQLEKINRLAANQARKGEFEQTPSPSMMASLLDDCIELGTLPFSILARHAFIANAILRSLNARGVLSDEEVSAYQRSVPTVAGDFVRDVDLLNLGEMTPDDFFERYGHLRPGTYNILSPRYDSQPEVLDMLHGIPRAEHPVAKFVLSGAQHKVLETLLRECNFDTTPDGLMTYIGSAMQAREYAKLIFTRSVSDVLEIIAAWGREKGLSRDDLSYIDIRCILGAVNIKQARSLRERMRRVAEEGRRRHEVAMALHLPYLIRNETDAVIVPLLLSQPNFITQKTIRAPIAVLSDVDLQVQDLEGRVVVVENADPGYDWIFARAIAGLITMFGGANSHMAIRCAEFGLPAAIGCGEQLFERVVSSKVVEINCAEKRVTPLEH